MKLLLIGSLISEFLELGFGLVDDTGEEEYLFAAIDLSIFQSNQTDGSSAADSGGDISGIWQQKGEIFKQILMVLNAVKS